MRISVVAMGVLLVGGCGDAHSATIAGIADDTRMVTLSDAQWGPLCVWIQTQSPAGVTYDCQGAMVVPADSCSMSGVHCVGYGWASAWCETNAAGARAHWTREPATCSVTVGQYAACVRSLRACYVAYPTTPECAAAQCPGDSPPVDVGVAPDGGA